MLSYLSMIVPQSSSCYSHYTASLSLPDRFFCFLVSRIFLCFPRFIMHSSHFLSLNVIYNVISSYLFLPLYPFFLFLFFSSLFFACLSPQPFSPFLPSSLPPFLPQSVSQIRPAGFPGVDGIPLGRPARRPK
jgi:hypothetical protein